jgi:peptidoglycan L-alanyl-D-glutamate endopeptidase CwlK
MSNFKLSSRSLSRLEGLDNRLVKIVKRAIEITRVDFGVIEGRRSVERQRELVSKGASQTMKSKHIDGLAVDLLAYSGGRGSWELTFYDDIADAMKLAGIENQVPIRWGAAWNVEDLTNWMGTSEEAMNHYIDTRRRQGRRPFIDAPHFELIPDVDEREIVYYGT